MTQLPHYIRKARYGYRLGHGELEDGIVSILTWPEGPYHNGMTAEFVAERFHISREAMDEFAWCSQQKPWQPSKRAFYLANPAAGGP